MTRDEIVTALRCCAGDSCEGCRVDEEKPVMSECYRWMFENPERAVKIVEEWAAAHPRKTRQGVFLGNYPCARIDSQSVLYACPADVYGDNVCPKKKDAAPITCYECRREFWTQEVQ